MAIRAPKQWQLTKTETITSFEAWRQNLQYTLSLDPNFAPYLIDGVTWERRTAAAPLRGFTDDQGDNGRTAAQKVTQLELMLGQIANYCPIISRNTIVKNSTSINSIWQAIRLHFGFQSTGGHFLDLHNIKLELNERPEDLYQRLTSFVEDNLLKGHGSISHHGVIPEVDEELTPTVENFIILTWLRLLHPGLPTLVKQKFATELRSKTLATLKPEISLAITSLLDEIHTLAEAKVLRSTFQKSTNLTHKQERSSPSCPLCKQAGRQKTSHFLSKCKFLPENDRKFMNTSSKIRQATNDESDDSDTEDVPSELNFEAPVQRVLSTRRVSTKQSPILRAFFKHFPLQLTLDSGAEISMIKQSVAEYIGAHVTSTNQSALQADGVTPLKIIGETHITLSRGPNDLLLEALVVNDLDVDILAGIPFMAANDIAIRPAKLEITIRDNDKIHYGVSKTNPSSNSIRRTQAFVVRAEPISTVVWPGSYVELTLPKEIEHENTISFEPKSNENSYEWPKPQILNTVGGHIRLTNDTETPQRVPRHDHVGYVRMTSAMDTQCDTIFEDNKLLKPDKTNKSGEVYSKCVSVDPDSILSNASQQRFRSLLQTYDDVFSPSLSGYNGADGNFEAKINMGPVQPPQRKGRVPQYSRNKLVELQQKFDDLEQLGVFKRPEDVGVTAEYLNPSFLIKKPQGGYRLVTAFSDVGRYSKPQPSLMPDVDSTLRTIGQWKYVIKSDLTSAFYQIPLSKESMKYCGVATPFKGVRLYTRCAMGMPGSETALEELMCRILGDLVQEGCVAKLADDLYCGANTIDDLFTKWEQVLRALSKNNLKLSPSKTVICPRSTTILGWIWSEGRISASPHRIAPLSSCSPPRTVCGLRSFIGAYKVLGRVLPHASSYLSPLDEMAAGKASQEKLTWTDSSLKLFHDAQNALGQHKSIAIPRPTDQLWIVTDGSVSQRGIGATLYVTRDRQLLLAGFFSAKLRKHQVTWLPCEIEALSIAAAVKHYSPYIIQSDKQACVLTDSQPCVQAVEKLCRGEFSASPRVTSFLSIISRYQINVRHLAGSSNVPSDFASRNAPECSEPQCQICTFILQTEESVVRSVQIESILNQTCRLPFASRSAWLQIQADCPDLRRTHAHLKQGTRPSKKLTNIKDVKRYLQVASIGKDNLLVVKRNDPLLPPADLIIVPRSVLDGLVTALHIKLDHPSKHQLGLVMKRNFYALDLHSAIERVTSQCHLCTSLKAFPNYQSPQSSEDPPEVIGMTFAADILKRNSQNILIVRETVTSYTKACIVSDEKRDSIRDALICLCSELHPLDGPPAIIRVDPAPGFASLQSDDNLRRMNIEVEVGRVKNVNKNPVAERAIQELENELLRYDPGGGPVSPTSLAITVARLNARIRREGLSSRELWTQRSQFTHDQLPVSDRDVILRQHQSRLENHPCSEKCKSKIEISEASDQIRVGDLVYLYSDKSKVKARNRYLVVSCEGEWCHIKKFTGNQLRASSYKVKLNECYRVPYNQFLYNQSRECSKSDLCSDDECDLAIDKNPVPIPPEIPTTLSLPNEIQNQGNLVPILIGEPEPPQEPVPQESIVNAPDQSVIVHQRPQRNKKTPVYLSDYVL